MKKTALALLPFVSLALPVQAEEAPSYPNISGELTLELQNDWTYDADDEDAEINDLYPTITLGTKLAFTKEFSVNLEATLEPVEDATDDRAFEDLGAFVNILTVNYDTDLFSVYAGKFTPNFGIAWDATPGLYGTDFNEDYELVEMIGLGGSINFSAGGDHSLSASTFFADTTFFSDSVGKSRGPLDEDDGGPANTESLESFAVALDGGFTALEGFRYHLGFSSLKDGEDGNEDQRGYVAGLEYGFNIMEELTATPLFEYAYFDNNGGTDGDTAQYATAALGFEYGSWSASASYQRRDTETGSTDHDDFILALTVGYSFENGIGLSGGWRHAEEEDVDSSGLGLLLEYAIEF